MFYGIFFKKKFANVCVTLNTDSANPHEFLNNGKREVTEDF